MMEALASALVLSLFGLAAYLESQRRGRQPGTRSYFAGYSAGLFLLLLGLGLPAASEAGTSTAEAVATLALSVPLLLAGAGIILRKRWAWLALAVFEVGLGGMSGNTGASRWSASALFLIPAAIYAWRRWGEFDWGLDLSSFRVDSPTPATGEESSGD